MKKITFIMALLLFTAHVFAQIKFEKGYFINNEGKRIDCYIENLDWKNNPTSFNYKSATTDAQILSQNIASVSEFGIDNASMYRRFTADVERSPTITDQLQGNKLPVWKNETLFLQAVVTGPANLYSLTDSNLHKFFFQIGDKPIAQLVMIRYIDDYKIKENNLFRQQLYNEVRCDKTVENSFTTLDYNTRSLSKLFNAYNSCFATHASKTVDYTAQDSERDGFVLRVMPGLYFASLKLTDPNQFYNVTTDFNGVVADLSLEFEYIFPFNKGAWSMFIKPGYQKFSANDNFTKPSENFNGNRPITYNATVDYTSLNFPIGVRRYIFINTDSKLYFSAALVLNTTLESDPKVYFSNTDNLINATQELPISARNNLMFGVAYSYKKFSIEARYNAPRQLSAYLSWSAKYSSVGASLGYKLF